MTWWDHDTGSVWSQPTGEAILGPRKGQRLELVPMTFTRWETWRQNHPDTLALDAPSGASGFDLDRMAIVVDLAGEAAVYPVPDLRPVGVVNDTVGDVPIVVSMDPTQTDAWKVFPRLVEDEPTTFRLGPDGLVDEATGSTWDYATGIAIAGPQAGESLGSIPALTSFPADVDTFWPDARWWQP